MTPKRTQEEKLAIGIAIRKLMTSPEWPIYSKELARLKDAVATGMFAETGENLAKSAGVIRGINMAISLDEMFK